MKRGKIIILSAPSGTGKSTIIGELMKSPDLHLEFSISATCRAPRGNECHGREYYFLTPGEFERRIEAGDFVEWEEVYAGTKYGTLRSEVERITGAGKNLIMDIDVKGALSVKQEFGDEALSIFIMPPDLQTLEKRLRGRNTDSEESLQKRLDKAEYELSFANQFDKIVVNDDLAKAVVDVKRNIRSIINT